MLRLSDNYSISKACVRVHCPICLICPCFSSPICLMVMISRHFAESDDIRPWTQIPLPFQFRFIFLYFSGEYRIGADMDTVQSLIWIQIPIRRNTIKHGGYFTKTWLWTIVGNNRRIVTATTDYNDPAFLFNIYVLLNVLSTSIRIKYVSLDVTHPTNNQLISTKSQSCRKGNIIVKGNSIKISQPELMKVKPSGTSEFTSGAPEFILIFSWVRVA